MKYILYQCGLIERNIDEIWCIWDICELFQRITNRPYLKVPLAHTQ